MNSMPAFVQAVFEVFARFGRLIVEPHPNPKSPNLIISNIDICGFNISQDNIRLLHPQNTHAYITLMLAEYSGNRTFDIREITLSFGGEDSGRLDIERCTIASGIVEAEAIQRILEFNNQLDIVQQRRLAEQARHGLSSGDPQMIIIKPETKAQSMVIEILGMLRVRYSDLIDGYFVS